MRLVGGFDKEVAQWAGQRLGVKFVEPLSAFAIQNSKGEYVGAAIFNDYMPGGNIAWSHVGRGSLTPGVLRSLARYCFVENKASRVTCKTLRGNKLVQRLLPKAGFEFEGTQKRYFGPTKDDDALVFVLFKDKAQRWLTTGAEGAGTAISVSH